MLPHSGPEAGRREDALVTSGRRRPHSPRHSRETAVVSNRRTRRRLVSGGRSRGSIEGSLLAATLALTGLGVVMSYSATAPLALDDPIPPLFVKHLSAACLGGLCALIAARISLSNWRRAALPLWAAGVVLLTATAWMGTEINGAQRWLTLPVIDLRFQPAELAKCFTLMAVAALLCHRNSQRELSPRRGLAAVGLTVPPVALLLLQPDLGSAVLLCALVGILLLVAGMPLKYLAAPVLLAPGALWLYTTQHAYALRRLLAFWDPWARSQGDGFQLVQSFVAFSVGGLDGAGLGNGRQKLFYLPEAHTDFILALIAEELGLLGVLFVLAAFGVLLVAGTGIARRASNRFALFLALGMTGLLALPAIVNAAVVMGLLPTKGLTLPFLSYGRTSLLVCCFAVGILFGIGRRNPSSRSDPVSAESLRGLAWR